MLWIIRHCPSGRYICSIRLSVCRCEFARKFNSVRQARIFMRKSDFLNDDCIVEAYNPENHVSYNSAAEISDYIRYNFFGLNRNK